jgi:hypothetical protein
MVWNVVGTVYKNQAFTRLKFSILDLVLMGISKYESGRSSGMLLLPLERTPFPARGPLMCFMRPEFCVTLFDKK